VEEGESEEGEDALEEVDEEEGEEDEEEEDGGGENEDMPATTGFDNVTSESNNDVTITIERHGVTSKGDDIVGVSEERLPRESKERVDEHSDVINVKSCSVTSLIPVDSVVVASVQTSPKKRGRKKTCVIKLDGCHYTIGMYR